MSSYADVLWSNQSDEYAGQDEFGFMQLQPANPQSIFPLQMRPSQPAITSPTPSHPSPQYVRPVVSPPPNQPSGPRLEVTLPENLHNRLQWNYLICKFTDAESCNYLQLQTQTTLQGKPMFVGSSVQFDSSILYVDGRRRNADDTEVQTSESSTSNSVINIMVFGTCATTGRPLRKCQRCKEKDKSLTKRKRKRNEDDRWSAIDENNNSKMIQVFSCGDENINDDGEIALRVRIGCCIGVSKQHHYNHVYSDDDGKEKADVHKNCEGMILTVQATTDDGTVVSASTTRALRVLGKVTDADRLKYTRKGNDTPGLTGVKFDTITCSDFSPAPYSPKCEIPTFTPTHSSARAMEVTPISITTTHDIEDVGLSAKIPRQFRGCSSCAACGDRELFAAITPAKMKPSTVMQHFASTYRVLLEKEGAKASIPSLYSDGLFSKEFTASCDPDSPAMLQVYTVLAVGACISGFLDTAEEFWASATSLANTLLATKPFRTKKDVVQMIDALNRLSFFFGSGGDALRGRHYNTHAYQLLELLSDSAELRGLPAYETCLWGRVCYAQDNETFREALAWSRAGNKVELEVFTTFLYFMVLMCPSIREYVDMQTQHPYRPFDLDNSKQAISAAMMQLKACLDKSGFKQMPAGPYNYGKMIDESLLAMDLYIEGRNDAAMQHAQTVVIQASLIDHPTFAVLVPAYIAAWLFVKFAQESPDDAQRCADLAELSIKSIVRISHYRWVRVIADYLIDEIRKCTGRCIALHSCPIRDRNYDAQDV